VNSSLGLDGHGKALSFLVLGDISVRVPVDCIPLDSPYRKALAVGAFKKPQE
jgi:hypothetical protein